MNQDFINPSNDVFKRVHPSGAETCVKTVDAISTEKSTVFISSSVGCPLKCKFCHLTIKGHKYAPISPEEIVSNTVETVKWAVGVSPKIRDKKLKLSWMGMGDALFDINWTLENSNKILSALPVELDKLDLSTAFPRAASIEEMSYLAHLQDYYGDKFRLFWSLFSAIPETRDYMIPHTKTPEMAVTRFRNGDLKVIAHQIFLNGVNDSVEEVEALIAFVNTNADVIKELRVLRYNECENSWWFESESLPWIVEKLKRELHVKLKLQESPGKEIKAACGMFHKL